jgi:uncharacterized membrane protein
MPKGEMALRLKICEVCKGNGYLLKDGERVICRRCAGHGRY